MKSYGFNNCQFSLKNVAEASKGSPAPSTCFPKFSKAYFQLQNQPPGASMGFPESATRYEWTKKLPNAPFYIIKSYGFNNRHFLLKIVFRNSPKGSPELPSASHCACCLPRRHFPCCPRVRFGTPLAHFAPHGEPPLRLTRTVRLPSLLVSPLSLPLPFAWSSLARHRARYTFESSRYSFRYTGSFVFHIFPHIHVSSW